MGNNALYGTETGFAISSTYSGVTYNVINGGTISTTGTTTVNFGITDIYKASITGGSVTGITFDFTNIVVGKTVSMVITSDGSTACVFNATSCKTFGAYNATKTNAISVLCISLLNPKFWVAIANT